MGQGFLYEMETRKSLLEDPVVPRKITLLAEVC